VRISPGEIISVGMGSDKPLVARQHAREEAKNRRYEDQVGL
jgi:outer membrane protein OmpA-like peptidoglycan-associated protein